MLAFRSSDTGYFSFQNTHSVNHPVLPFDCAAGYCYIFWQKAGEKAGCRWSGKNHQDLVKSQLIRAWHHFRIDFRVGNIFTE